MSLAPPVASAPPQHFLLVAVYYGILFIWGLCALPCVVSSSVRLVCQAYVHGPLMFALSVHVLSEIEKLPYRTVGLCGATLGLGFR